MAENAVGNRTFRPASENGADDFVGSRRTGPLWPISLALSSQKQSQDGSVQKWSQVVLFKRSKKGETSACLSGEKQVHFLSSLIGIFLSVFTTKNRRLRRFSLLDTKLGRAGSGRLKSANFGTFWGLKTRRFFVIPLALSSQRDGEEPGERSVRTFRKGSHADCHELPAFWSSDIGYRRTRHSPTQSDTIRHPVLHS